jgi:hypothetical protein
MKAANAVIHGKGSYYGAFIEGLVIVSCKIRAVNSLYRM